MNFYKRELQYQNLPAYHLLITNFYSETFKALFKEFKQDPIKCKNTSCSRVRRLYY